ncbi:MAG: 2-oxoglutarate dehydrogenase E1 component [Bacteroidales bacterium]|nr:2-oxoglutarate dehydrogenase E1 component [Bacteroidales bacterium]
MDKFSFLGNADPALIDKMYQEFLADPDSVEESWRNFFKGFEFARSFYASDNSDEKLFDAEYKVLNLIDAYRKRGHLFTKTNPVRIRRNYLPTLDLENFGLSEKDMDTVFQAGKDIGIGPSTLRNIVDFCKDTYCRAIGSEYMFIRNIEVVTWLRKSLEENRNTPEFSIEEKKEILLHLKQAVGFEKFIHNKFVGQKRFSLEGAESLIPALNSIIDKGAELGVKELIIGMSHRGRLNVLANVLRKPFEDIFSEFTGTNYSESELLGDVKYHLGYGNTVSARSGEKVRLNLVPNPSHLEAVGPVVQGISRAKIEHKYKRDFKKLIPVIIHGDAAVASQGVVYEVIQMSQLNGYKTGGTIHLVINNQVGFTTNYLDARSSTYCTDIAKVTKSPIFHVNGDDPEALVHTVNLAMLYRQTFHTDVFIDILCYRKYGHNEGDEPRFTQPLLYKKIAGHPNPFEIYSEKMVEQGIFSKEQIRMFQMEFEEILEHNFAESKVSNTLHIKQFLEEDWEDFKHPRSYDFKKSPETGVDFTILSEISKNINTLPTDKNFFKKVHKLMQDRANFFEEGFVDWAMAELLAYGSLVYENHPVRVSGQDSERGTFSHRHAALVVEDTDEKYFPLKHVSENQAAFHVYNSPLSEYGVLGFEYGYALSQPKGLTVWEAQFGDFHNVGQVIIDQYIASAEEKWGLMNGLVLLLPHGFEGQGPEHSSARIERFLELCANNNIQIVNCTTPANFFHALRRQVKRDFEVPLIVFSPKSLLRHPECISPVTDLTSGGFNEVIDDDISNSSEIEQIVFTSGKIYYELKAQKALRNAESFAIIRIEQLYPAPIKQIKEILDKYSNARRFVWVQEEPANMGAWTYINRILNNIELELVARPPSGSPATGLGEIHKMQQNKLMDKTFRRCNCERKNIFCGLQCTSKLESKKITK